MTDEQKLVYITAYSQSFVRQIFDKMMEGSGAPHMEEMNGYAEESSCVAQEAAMRFVMPESLEE